MKIFLVHTLPGHDPKVVRDGFSLTAFIFTGFWALWNRMWFLKIIIFLSWAVLWGVFRFLALSDDSPRAAKNEFSHVHRPGGRGRGLRAA